VQHRERESERAREREIEIERERERERGGEKGDQLFCDTLCMADRLSRFVEDRRRDPMRRSAII
jgi:hypothetical protein